MSTENARGTGQSKIGVVLKKSGKQTVKVQVERVVIHPKYKRYIRSRKTFLAHDQDERCAAGDTVEIFECRPISARKRWRVRRVIGRQEAAVHALETRHQG